MQPVKASDGAAALEGDEALRTCPSRVTLTGTQRAAIIEALARAVVAEIRAGASQQPGRAA